MAAVRSDLYRLLLQGRKIEPYTIVCKIEPRFKSRRILTGNSNSCITEVFKPEQAKFGRFLSYIMQNTGYGLYSVLNNKFRVMNFNAIPFNLKAGLGKGRQHKKNT
ncbi:hypothetical protein SAMN05660461_0228 [Chitinophaga ginsengisegetis]|uniref:Uncharacterized protein n=1 Tax=Chitinophaga ginsengisegetis TaxID=393003 RepID=A0A1T5N3T0_9BACT|nr:hypothetical protein SAMN05660461_0228 [Chitinophaga ginsengisegetis]